jgi:hypothetical protein
VKIVPLGRYQNVIEACKKLGTSWDVTRIIKAVSERHMLNVNN